MPLSPATITGVDFVAIPVRNLQASTRFYKTVLGIAGNYPWADMGLEFQVGNLTLALMELERFGIHFEQTAHLSPYVCRMSPPREQDYKPPASSLRSNSIRMSAIKRSFTIPMETLLSYIIAMPQRDSEAIKNI